MIDSLTLVTTYYCQPLMLERQVEVWHAWPPEILERIRIVLVDDGSPPPLEAETVLERLALLPRLRQRLSLYRIDEDIPWNHPGARNLGCHVAPHGWLLRVDLDHALRHEAAARLLDIAPRKARFYRFEREQLHAGESGIEVRPRKPHVDSYLMHRTLYWKVGGYDEDYSGCYYCVDTEFFRNLWFARCHVLPIPLTTYADIADSSTPALSRGPEMAAECKRRREDKHRRRAFAPERPLRFSWRAVWVP